MGNQHIPEHEESETQFNYIPERVSNRYDKQFAHVQRLVPLPCTFYSINSGEVAPRPVTMCLEVGELFPSKKHLESKLEEVQGTPVESYSILPSYLYMLEQENPGTVTDLHTDSSNRLHKAVGEFDDLVIVSDRKGSITTGVEKVFPNSFHGACAVHLERNMVGHYGRNKALKQYFRRAARVYRESQFLQRMEQLAHINPEAAQYVTDVGIERWVRAYNPRKRYNIMLTNIAEVMNNAIKKCKELPITGVIDYIKGILQRWFHDQHSAALKLTTQLTTAADVAIDVKDEEARYMRVYPITFYTFHFKDGGLDRPFAIPRFFYGQLRWSCQLFDIFTCLRHDNEFWRLHNTGN
ncbi:hypothetical protein Ddye_024316 [Dipteronia dyeriana]|uniref:Transposase n=1 Tax=Dipteronia dyeriana TaxID=168575 RepID=A0AAD9TV96_9ROSI|nr:hypothetical protein Ddye_024316 [Dipteronia dyeriana]